MNSIDEHAEAASQAAEYAALIGDMEKLKKIRAVAHGVYLDALSIVNRLDTILGSAHGESPRLAPSTCHALTDTCPHLWLPSRNCAAALECEWQTAQGAMTEDTDDKPELQGAATEEPTPEPGDGEASEPGAPDFRSKCRAEMCPVCEMPGSGGCIGCRYRVHPPQGGEDLVEGKQG